MHYMLCIQKVENFDEFKKVLASHDAAHQAAGFRVQRLGEIWTILIRFSLSARFGMSLKQRLSSNQKHSA